MEKKTAADIIIVVLLLSVLAFFIRLQWEKLDPDYYVNKELTETEKELQKKIIAGNSPLAFLNETSSIPLNMAIGGFFGLKNEFPEERTFGFVIVCVDGFCANEIMGGIGALSEKKWFQLFSETDILPGDTKMLMYQFDPINESSGKYTFRMDVYAGNETGGDPIVDPANLYTSEEFTVVVI